MTEKIVALVRVQKGNAVLTTTLPKKIAEALGLDKGDLIQMEIEPGAEHATLRKAKL